MRSESAGPDDGLQRADVDVEFLRRLVEWQLLVLSLVIGDRVAGALQHCDGDDASPSIPWPEGLERNRQERGELALSRTDRSTQFAKLVHRCPHDAIRRGGRKATSGLHGR
jgi:hypothetical protein